MSTRLAATYVVPLRWTDDAPLPELTDYFRRLSRLLAVVVVDGSPEPLFAAHAAAWAGVVTHLPPSGRRTRNGKVQGVTTGVLAAGTELVVLADDDVRYTESTLTAVVELLATADLVGPQNVFDPMPWHALWDTGRSLLNRSLGADYPGTFGLRRSTFVAMGGYDGDVLFENLELMRTVRAHGGRVVRPRGVYVVRRPPTAAHFWGQRVRQAYDDLAQPWRMAAFLPLAPLAVLGGRRGRSAVAAALASSVLLAERGRRRDGGGAVFPAVSAWLAPLWVGERALCSWAAVWCRLVRGGVPYSGGRLAVAAHTVRTLRRRAATVRPLVATAGAEAGTVRPVAERLESRPAAAAQCDDRTSGLDLLTVVADDTEVASHEQRSVGVRRDDRAAAS